MRPRKKQAIHLSLILLLIGTLGTAHKSMAEQPMPTGLMLNLDFQNIKEGLVPNKTLYPLYLPIGKLTTQTLKERTLLFLQEGQGLDIPHSSLLDPNGTSWIVSIQVLAQTDGIIVSQGNNTSGYVIYLKDGIVHATIQTGDSTLTLKEKPGSGPGSILKKQVSITLKMESDSASMVLNRNRVIRVPFHHPLAGKNHRIRIGEHPELPAPLKQIQGSTTTGFTGGISSFKIIRQ